MDLKNCSIEEIREADFKCFCGRRHRVNIEAIVTGEDILEDLILLLEDYRDKSILLVGDENTFQAAGKKIFSFLKKDFDIDSFIYEDEVLVADAKSLGDFLMALDKEYDLIVTVGSGTLNDISRYISTLTKIPYIIIATAPSMDGYASSVSPLIKKGVKVTLRGLYPKAILGDLNILKSAPIHMIQAGLGDVLGKFTGLSDWEMSYIMGFDDEEPYCDNIKGLVRGAVNRCVSLAPSLLDRSDETVKAIMEGLSLSGLSISLAGHSRPASGSEHQISHYLEMKFLEAGVDSKWLHGNKVGMATHAVIEAYDYLFSQDIEEIKEFGRYKNFDEGAWRARIKATYGPMAGDIFSLKSETLLRNSEAREDRMNLIIKNWDRLVKSVYNSLPTADEYRDILLAAGALYNPKDMAIDRNLFKDSLMVSKEIRNRYGIIQLLDDLGLLEEAAELITSKYYD